MLSNEYGMTSHGSLTSVVRNILRCKPAPYKILAVLTDDVKPLFAHISLVLSSKVKAAAEFGAAQPYESFVYRAHYPFTSSSQLTVKRNTTYRTTVVYLLI